MKASLLTTLAILLSVGGASGQALGASGKAGGALHPHGVSITWYGPGSPRLEHRIALYAETEEAGWQWVVFSGTAQPKVDRDTNPDDHSGPRWGQWSWEYELDTTGNDAEDYWRGDDFDVPYTVPNMMAATQVRVDTRVDDTGPWKKGTPTDIP